MHFKDEGKEILVKLLKENVFFSILSNEEGRTKLPENSQLSKEYSPMVSIVSGISSPPLNLLPVKAYFPIDFKFDGKISRPVLKL